MKFAVFSRRSARGDDEALQQEIELLMLAEQQGYDAAWLGEPHDSRHAVASSTHQRVARLAARTDRIRIGMAVTLQASIHPLRIAEEVALLDIMSAGRLVWSVGPGRPSTESVEPGESLRVFEEQLAVVKQAWAGLPFSHQGEFFRFPTLECFPTPEQDPHPPIHVCAALHETFEWAGRAGYPVLADAFLASEALGKHRETHHDSAKQARSDVGSHALPTVRPIYVGETSAKAREQAEPALRAYGGGLLERCSIVGDAAHCRDRLLELQERAGLDSLLAWQNFDGLPHELALASQRRLIEEVAPAFA